MTFSYDLWQHQKRGEHDERRPDPARSGQKQDPTWGRGLRTVADGTVGLDNRAARKKKPKGEAQMDADRMTRHTTREIEFENE